MAAAREEARERRLERVGLEVERRDVPLEVIDGDERQSPRPRDRLGGRQADEQRAHEPRALRHADAIEVVEPDTRVLERSSDDRRNELEVASRGDLGNDAAEPRVKLGLRGDDRRQHRAVARDDRGRGLVARGLDAEDVQPTPSSSAGSAAGSGSRHMMSASSRLSV